MAAAVPRNNKTKGVVKTVLALATAYCVYRSRHYIGAITKLMPLAWHSYQYVKEQQTAGAEVDPRILVHRALDCQLTAEQITAVLNLARWTAHRILGEQIGKAAHLSLRISSVDYGNRSYDGGRVQGRACTVELGLRLNDLQVGNFWVDGVTVNLELVVVLPAQGRPGDAIAVGATLIGLRPLGRPLMQGRIRLGEAEARDRLEIDLEGTDRMMGRDLFWLDHDAVVRPRVPQVWAKLGSHGRVYPERQVENPLWVLASARLPRIPSWQRAALGEEEGKGGDDFPVGAGGEPPEDCVEFQLRFRLKPAAKSFDIKRFFGSVKPLIQFAQAELPAGALELVSEPDLAMPVYAAGSLQPAEEQTQRCLVLGIRLSPAAMGSRSVLEPIEAAVESLSVDAGVGLDISFSELAELAMLLVAQQAGGKPALQVLQECLMLALGRSGCLRGPQVEELLRANADAQAQPGLANQNQNQNQASLCSELRRRLQALKAEAGLEPRKLLKAMPEKLAAAVQVMDRNLEKIAAGLSSILIAAPRREARLEVHLGGVAYQDLQRLL